MTVSSPQERKRLGESLYTRALGLASEGQLDEAEHHFEEALNLCPQDARIWYHRGHLHEQMGKLESSIHCYNKARSLDRSNPMYERAWREAVKMLDQLPAVPTDAVAVEEPAPVPAAAPVEVLAAASVEVPVAAPEEKKAVIDLPPVFDPVNEFEAQTTQMFDEHEDDQTVHGGDPDTVRTVERIGGTWVLWNSPRKDGDDDDDLDTLRTSSDQMFSNASSATLVVPLDELENEEPAPTSEGLSKRDTASFVNRRNARILDSGQLSVIGKACLRLIAEGDSEQVLELMLEKKYPDLEPAEAHFLLATAYITLAEQALLDARGLEGGLAEHLKTLKLWFEQR